MKMIRGLYIHIPFCKSKCTYCDFYSVPLKEQLMASYVNALIKEIELTAKKHPDTLIDTIYLGGGTPSVLSLILLEKIVEAIYKHFKVNIKEFTMEINPSSSIDFRKLKALGINRISIGIQTLNDDLLALIGRRHDKALALTTLEEANKYFDNVSCDLMIGLPKQNVDDVNYAVEYLAKKVNHISMYMLKLSENVEMYRAIERGNFSLPDDDLVVDFYESAYAIMKENGFYRYEISNFAKPGFESQHNLKYWNREEYLGLGAAAHGFVNDFRYFNPSDINLYVNNVNYGNGNVSCEKINKKEALFETIMLGLRLSNGLNINQINNDFNINFEDLYAKQLSFLDRFIIKDNGRIILKDDYLLLESAVVREFMK